MQTHHVSCRSKPFKEDTNEHISFLKDLCKQNNVENHGTKDDMLNRLIRNQKSTDTTAHVEFYSDMYEVVNG